MGDLIYLYLGYWDHSPQTTCFVQFFPIYGVCIIVYGTALCNAWVYDLPMQMFNKLEQARAELTDLKDEFRREREDLEQTQEELTRELKLK